MTSRRQAAKSAIRHIAVPQAETDIFATAEYEENVTLWSLHRRKKLTELKTVLDFGATRVAVIQEPGLRLLAAAGFEGPVNAYDFEGKVLWSRRDLVEVQHLTSITSCRGALVGVGLEGKTYEIVSALDGRQVYRLADIRKLYSGHLTTNVIGITSKSVLCLAEFDSIRLWEKPMRSFSVLHASLSSREAVYCEAAGSMYCFGLDGTQKWVVQPERNRHFLRASWNQATGKWMAVDWDYENGGSKRLHEVSPTGNAAFIADLGEPAETEFFADGDRLITSNGDILDSQSGELVWSFL